MTCSPPPAAARPGLSGADSGAHDDAGCALALLTEYAGDYFRELHGHPRAAYELRDLLIKAAGTVGDFAAALHHGEHGQGCPVRTEQDRAESRAGGLGGWLDCRYGGRQLADVIEAPAPVPRATGRAC